MNTIYHITKLNNWKAAVQKGTYDFCSLKREGFIHCSKESQYLRVANARFINEELPLVVLIIDSTKILSKIIYENLEGGTENFPHIYGPINLDAIIKAVPFIKKNRSEFAPIS